MGLLGRSEVRRVGERLLELNDAVRSWIALGFDVVGERAEAVQAVAGGSLGLPDLLTSLDVDGEGGSSYAWKVVDEGILKVEELGRHLRSTEMRDVVEFGFGHRLLTDLRFAGLGDDR